MTTEKQVRIIAAKKTPSAICFADNGVAFIAKKDLFHLNPSRTGKTTSSKAFWIAAEAKRAGAKNVR